MYVEEGYENPVSGKHRAWWIGIVGLACSGFVFAQGVPWSALDKSYTVYADFMSVSGLRQGAEVELAGVKIGDVADISLTRDNWARVKMRIHNNVSLPEDSSLMIKSRGLTGNKVISVSKGASKNILKPSGILVETESGADIEDLFTKLFFGGMNISK